VEKSARKSAQNLQVTCAEFAIFWCRILTTLLLQSYTRAKNQTELYTCMFVICVLLLLQFTG